LRELCFQSLVLLTETAAFSEDGLELANAGFGGFEPSL
jgi:hypothetical protein